MPKKNIISTWDVFWMSRIVREVEQVWYDRHFLCECLNCGESFTKNIRDLRKSNRPRTCWKCKYRKDAVIAIPWNTYHWFTFLEEVENHNWNRMARVINPEWNEVVTQLYPIIMWIARRETDTRFKHWMHEERFYKIYRGILQRCNNKNNTAYQYYGGRWITCEWETFEEFKTDMLDLYMLAHKNDEKISIDRIDPNWNYCKENCRWVDKSVQMNNRKWVIKIPKKYWNKTLLEICEEYWIARQTVYRRLRTWYTLEEALNKTKWERV